MSRAGVKPGNDPGGPGGALVGTDALPALADGGADITRGGIGPAGGNGPGRGGSAGGSPSGGTVPGVRVGNGTEALARTRPTGGFAP
jgi:hypothetical protein